MPGALAVFWLTTGLNLLTAAPAGWGGRCPVQNFVDTGRTAAVSDAVTRRMRIATCYDKAAANELALIQLAINTAVASHR